MDSRVIAVDATDRFVNVAFDMAVCSLNEMAQRKALDVVSISHEHLRHNLGIDDWVSTVTILAVVRPA